MLVSFRPSSERVTKPCCPNSMMNDIDRANGGEMIGRIANVLNTALNRIFRNASA